MENLSKIQSIPKGTTDYYGNDARLRDEIISRLTKVYEKYGFEALYTPIIENAEVFKGHHGEGEKLLFKFSDKKGEEYVLKYDSTVPLARVVSMHNDIPLPYKRYQFQQSFRDDEIDKGHYREFIQCDGDIVGTESLSSDAEFIMISHEGLQSLGFDDFTIRINHRKLIKGIADLANYTTKEQILSIQRAIDIADKINKGSIDDIRSELLKANIEKKIVDIIIELVEIANKNSVRKSLDEIKYYFKNSSANGVQGATELKEIISYVPENMLDNVKVDFTLARGADYYTGFILEGIINNVKLGAVLGGGRYDDLVDAFGGGNVPAVGMAFGLERIIVSLKELGLDRNLIDSSKTKMLVYASPSNKASAIKLATHLRKNYNVSLIFNTDVPSDRLLEYCRYNNISELVIPMENLSYTLQSVDELERRGIIWTRKRD